MSSRDCAEWLAWGTMEPWGERRDDWRIAVAVSQILAALSDGKHQTPQPKDLLMRFRGAEPPKDWREMRKMMRRALTRERDGVK